MSGARVLLTGASGFVGRHLLHDLAARGYRVRTAGRGGTPILPGGEHVTIGDLGVLSPDGYVKLKDRAKDIIISGGENISSIEVEDTLYKHPAVLACAVVARPDPRWGETPLAFVELKADHVPASPQAEQALADELIAHCRKHLAGFKCPREVRFAEVPKTSTGKIQKFELRNQVQSASAIGSM